MLTWVERYGPAFLAVSAALASLVYWPNWQLALQQRGQEFSDALGPVFDFATFSAGSLFAIYFLALSRGDGFLGRIFQTETFRQFHSYVSKALFLNVTVSLWSASMMIIGLAPKLSTNLVALWIGVSLWSLLATARVVLIFLLMVRVKGGRPFDRRAEWNPPIQSEL